MKPGWPRTSLVLLALAAGVWLGPETSAAQAQPPSGSQPALSAAESLLRQIGRASCRERV